MTDTVQLLLLCCGSILVGGVFIYLLFLRRKPDTHVKEQEEKKHQQQQSHQRSDQREVNNVIAASSTSKKQAKSKKRREAQQEFTHSWMVGALKGHTGTVLDINFSANGKFLASSAEEEAAGKSSTITKAKKLQQEPQPPPSPSGSSKSSASSSSSEQEPRRTILSRRQRKNRTRVPRRDHDDDRPPPSSHSTPSLKQDKKARLHRQQKAVQPVKEPKTSHNKTMAYNSQSSYSNYGSSSKKVKLHHQYRSESLSNPNLLANLSEADLSSILNDYVLTHKQMEDHGYPLESSKLTFDHQHPHSTLLRHKSLKNQYERKPGAHSLDANAREFVPRSWAGIVSGEVDSGRGSSSSSSHEGSDLEQGSSSDSDKSSETSDSVCYKNNVSRTIERHCVRCSKAFYVWREDGEYVCEDRCSYHWGKCRSNVWECCHTRGFSRGCTHADAHVWRGTDDNESFKDFVRTEPAKHTPMNGNYGVYALDCEMCFTKRGLEIGRVTFVDLNGQVIYETMIKPEVDIIDYNTRFSGLRKQDFDKAKSLREVHQDLKRFVFAETILIGHALENDLRALKLFHSKVIDTTVWYPHTHGLPFRNSLKSLARSYLNKDIQLDEHDSAEDARIALQLMYYIVNYHLNECETAQFWHRTSA